MSTIGEKVGGAVTTVQQFVTNPATAAQVVGRDAIALMIDRAMTLGDPKNDSLVSFTQAARVEPTCLVDTAVLFVDELSDVLQSMNSIFAGYYLQAIQLNSTIGHVKILETLEKFNPNRNPIHAAAHAGTGIANTIGHAYAVHKTGHGIGPGPNFSMEAFNDALPDYVMDDIALEADGKTNSRARQLDPDAAEEQDYKKWRREREKTRAQQQDEERDFKLGQMQQQANDRHAAGERQKKLDQEREADRSQAHAEREGRAHKEALTEAEQQRQLQKVSSSYGSDAIKEIKEATNLSVGKMLDVEIKHNGQVFQVPIAIRMVVNTIPSAQLVHILSLSNSITSMKERFHAWNAGRLSFVKDIIFARDLIDEHRRNLMKDGDSVYTNVIRKESKNLAAALLGGEPSIGAASNMIVVAKSTIDELELTMPGKFEDFHARQQIFNKTSLMIVAVIDQEWNRVTFYHRGLPEATDVSFRDLKQSAKGSGPDVSDILKAYTLGNAPRL
jgi:hypothetical protein